MLRDEVQTSSQVSDTMKNDNVSTDMLINGLVYRVPASLSLVSERTNVKNYPAQQNFLSANGATCTFDLNSGTSYVNPENSYLMFDLKLVSALTTSTAHFGSGSACNIIRSVILKSRSGTELSRADYLNVESRLHHSAMLSGEYLRRTALIEGWDTSESGTSGTVRVNALTASRFVLPLARISPFFRSYKKSQKLPPAVMAGMHIEIVFEDFRTAFVGVTAGGSITNYDVTNICMVLDSSSMTDDTQRAINSEAASNGLEIVSRQYHVQQMNSLSGETTLNAQVRKAVSQGECVNIAILNTANIQNIAVDSFAGFAGDAISTQFRLGSMYFPKSPIVNSETQQLENYFSLLQCHNKNDMVFAESGVTYNTFKDGPYYSLNATFEKDQSLQCSGLSVNNSRSIESLITFQNADRARTFYVILNYISVIRTFIDNVSVAS